VQQAYDVAMTFNIKKRLETAILLEEV